MTKEKISLIELKEALSYDEASGKFTWRLDRPVRHFKTPSAHKVYLSRFAGKVAGCNQKVSDLIYTTIRIKGVLYLAHRLAWFYNYEEWPKIIDHANGDTLDNRMVNLKNGDSVDSGRNCKLSKNNTSGVNGVWWSKGNSNWVAEGHYTEHGVHKKTSLGSYTSLKEAKAARLKWETENNFSARHGK